MADAMERTNNEPEDSGSPSMTTNPIGDGTEPSGTSMDSFKRLFDTDAAFIEQEIYQSTRKFHIQKNSPHPCSNQTWPLDAYPGPK
jgi:hypothetical protein